MTIVKVIQNYNNQNVQAIIQVFLLVFHVLTNGSIQDETCCEYNLYLRLYKMTMFL